MPKAKLQVLLPRAGLLVDTGASVDHVRSVCPPPSTGPLKLQIMALIALLQSALASSAVPGDETSFVANCSFGLDAQAISYIMFCWVVLQIIGLAIGLCIYMKPGWVNRSSTDLRNIGIQTSLTVSSLTACRPSLTVCIRQRATTDKPNPNLRAVRLQWRSGYVAAGAPTMRTETADISRELTASCRRAVVAHVPAVEFAIHVSMSSMGFVCGLPVLRVVLACPPSR